MTDTAKLPTSVSKLQETYRCPYMAVTHQRAEFGTFSKDYYVVRFGRRAGVVAVRNGGEILLVRQYRFLINAESWELPGGTIDGGEDLEAGLARECREETGILPRNLERLIEYYPGLDNVDNRTSIFVSHEVEVAAPFRAAPAEVVAIDWLPADQCVRMVFAGEILDAMTVAGILAYARSQRRA